MSACCCFADGPPLSEQATNWVQNRFNVYNQNGMFKAISACEKQTVADQITRQLAGIVGRLNKARLDLEGLTEASARADKEGVIKKESARLVKTKTIEMDAVRDRLNNAVAKCTAKIDEFPQKVQQGCDKFPELKPEQQAMLQKLRALALAELSARRDSALRFLSTLQRRLDTNVV